MVGLVAILSSLILITGSILPWFREGLLSGNGIYNLDGTCIFFSGITLLVLSVLNALKKTNHYGILFLVLGICCFLIATLDLLGITNSVELLFRNYAGLNEPVPGNFSLPEYLIINTGSIGMMVTGFFINKKNDPVAHAQSMTAAFVATRIAFNQQKSFSRFIIRLSTVATVVSVMVMIVTLSFANGFQEKVSQKVFSFLGHIRIQEKQLDRAIISEQVPIYKKDTLANEIRNMPGVAAVYPFITKYALLKTKDELEGVLLKGIDSSYDFGRVRPFLKEGRPVNFNDSSYSREIMISAYTADQLKLKLNDRVLMYFLKENTSVSEEGGFPAAKANRLTIVGIYKTGIEDYDKTAIADMKMIQRLTADSVSNDAYLQKIGGYEIFLDDYKQIDPFARDIYDLYDFPLTWDTVSAKSISPNIFDWLNMQDTTRNILIIFMVIVAVINLITCLIILVLERIRMIGILKSLGATDWAVQQVFMRHSALITVIGIIAGTILGLAILWLQQATGFIRLKEEAYYISEAAVKIIWWQVALVCIITFIVCFLIMMIPSLLVRKVQPVKAIHFR